MRWLRELFELPDEFGGVLVTGATMANFTGLLAARSWWAERHGIDVDEAASPARPRPRILTGGYVHPSAVQASACSGWGAANVAPAGPRRRRAARPRRRSSAALRRAAGRRS